MRCVVPTGKKTDMRLDTVPSSACKDKRKSSCRLLSSFKNASFEEQLECTRYFSAGTCAAVDRVNDLVLAKQPPACITRIVNSCLSEESDDGAKRALIDTSTLDFTATGSLASWNVYSRELYEFLLPFWQVADADDTDNDTDATDLQALISSTSHVQPAVAVPPASAEDRAISFIEEVRTAATTADGSDLRLAAFDAALADPASDAFSMIVAMIDGLTIADMTLTLTTDVVPIDFDYDGATLYDMTRENVDDLISNSNHNGQSVKDNYRTNVVDVANFDNMQTMAWNVFSSADSPCSSLLTSHELNTAVLSLHGITQGHLTEGFVMRDILTDMRQNIEDHGLMTSDESQSMFAAMHDSTECTHAIRNVAAVMEIANRLTDQTTIADTLIDEGLPDTTTLGTNGITDQQIMDAVDFVLPGAALYTSANAGDFNQDLTVPDLNHQIAVKASELAGGDATEQLAIGQDLSDSAVPTYTVSMDNAINQLSENAMSKQIYQQIVTAFFESATGGNLGDGAIAAGTDPSFEYDLAGCIESMKNPSFGAPAEEVRCDLMGCMMQAGSGANVERLSALFEGRAQN